MHRFLGYDLKNMTHQYVAFILDFILLVLVHIVWKPLAIWLIYIELVLRAGYLTVLCVYQFAAFTLKETVLSRVAPPLPDDMRKLQQNFHNLLRCLSCIISLSLFLRWLSCGWWFSSRLSTSALRKHDRLAKNSLLYRVFRHII